MRTKLRMLRTWVGSGWSVAARCGARLLVVVAMSVVALGVLAPTAGSAGADGYRSARVDEAGVSLQYPRAWTVLSLTDKELATAMKRLRKTNPKAAQAFSIAAHALDADLVKFAARADLSNATPSSVTVGFVRGAGTFPSLDEFTKFVTRVTEREGRTVVNTSTVEVSGATAYRVDVSGPINGADGTRHSTHSGALYVHTSGDSLTTIIVNVFDDDADVATIDRILASVRRI